MDTSLSESEVERIYTILKRYVDRGVRYHALRTRQSGTRAFVSVHIQVPGRWSVQKGHDLLEEMEGEIRRALPSVTLLTHLEPAEDPSSWDDQDLDR